MDRTVAVVLTYRRPRLATQSIRYLLDREGLDGRDVLLVINGEGGLDDEELQSRIRVLHLDTNGGPAGGMRAGLEAATADADVSWVYLCEDDIGASELPAPRLAQLVEMARVGDSADGPLGAVAAYGRTLDRRTGLTRPHLPAATDVGLIPTDVAPWGASLVSRRVVDAGVLPDASLFFGYEDFDFWLALQEAGFRMTLDAACARALGSTVHPTGRLAALGHQRPIDDATPWRRYYEARNFIHLARRHGHAGWIAAHLAKSARRASLGQGEHRRAVAAGLVAGFRGRSGFEPRYQRAADGGELTGTHPEAGR